MSVTKPIMLTAKLYEARNAMKFLWGDRYAEKVKPVISQLHDLADLWKLSPLKTMIRALDVIDKGGGSGVESAMVIAAYVEDVEGTEL